VSVQANGHQAAEDARNWGVCQAPQRRSSGRPGPVVTPS
jgi:hypothetical protein